MKRKQAAVGHMSPAEKSDFLKSMDKVLYDIHRLSKAFNKGKPLMDNYNWRAVAIAAVLQEHEPTLAISKTRTGTDCWIRGRKARNIEIKTSGIPAGSVSLLSSHIKAEFDKQDREGALGKLLDFDGLIVAAFNDQSAVPVATIWVQAAGMASLAPIFKAKHAAFKAAWGAKGRDSIQVGLRTSWPSPTSIWSSTCAGRKPTRPLSRRRWPRNPSRFTRRRPPSPRSRIRIRRNDPPTWIGGASLLIFNVI